MTFVETGQGVAAAPAAILSLQQVAKTWPDGTHALEEVDLDLRKGELVTLVGPSGCGKSTVLRIVAGLDAATGGQVVVPEQLPGFVFQQPNLLPWRSVVGNVELFLQLDKAPADARREAVDDALELVGLERFRDHLPHQLSGGMQMRAALARALVTRPELLLFDEPFAAVDELLRERLQEELSRLFAARRFAGLFITHSVAEAVFLSTRVMVMTPQPGTIEEVIDVPFPHPRVAELRFDSDFVDLCHRVSRSMRRAGSDLEVENR
ncbi:MAG: ABC-type nitrate/sulfonate/bicarbonate transport system, ATPase component [Actinomycetia bacterium]|nr:ABC-type nitrate/sulfonate/bicarbonate transport system, ATPase component [Actinomycetes bacterium]